MRRCPSTPLIRRWPTWRYKKLNPSSKQKHLVAQVVGRLNRMLILPKACTRLLRSLSLAIHPLISPPWPRSISKNLMSLLRQACSILRIIPLRLIKRIPPLKPSSTPFSICATVKTSHSTPTLSVLFSLYANRPLATTPPMALT